MAFGLLEGQGANERICFAVKTIRSRRHNGKRNECVGSHSTRHCWIFFKKKNWQQKEQKTRNKRMIAPRILWISAPLCNFSIDGIASKEFGNRYEDGRQGEKTSVVPLRLTRFTGMSVDPFYVICTNLARNQNYTLLLICPTSCSS